MDIDEGLDLAWEKTPFRAVQFYWAARKTFSLFICLCMRKVGILSVYAFVNVDSIVCGY